MKNILLTILSFGFALRSCFAFDTSLLRFGDIFFSDMESGQAKAIKIATHSTFSHCGIIFSQDDKWYIIEAVQPVRIVPFDDFINAEINDALHIKRLKNAEELFTSGVRQKFLNLTKVVVGKNYDPYFEWSDKTYYCSELVWKLYSRVCGIELCQLRPMKDYHLNDPLVIKTMKQRFDDKIPYDQLMVSLQDLYDALLLIPVYP